MLLLQLFKQVLAAGWMNVADQPAWQAMSITQPCAPSLGCGSMPLGCNGVSPCIAGIADRMPVKIASQPESCKGLVGQRKGSEPGPILELSNLLLQLWGSDFEDDILSKGIFVAHDFRTRRCIIFILHEVLQRICRLPGVQGLSQGQQAHTVNLAPEPAPFSMRTPLKPALTKTDTPAGLKATLFSPAKVSLGTPCQHINFTCKKGHSRNSKEASRVAVPTVNSEYSIGEDLLANQRVDSCCNEVATVADRSAALPKN